MFDKYIVANERMIRHAQEEINKLNICNISLVARQRQMSEEDCVEEAFERVGLRKAYICLVEQNAQTIIEILGR